MPNGFEVFDGAEILSGWIQGGLVPAQHESQSAFLIMDSQALMKLRALVTAAEAGVVPPGLREHASDILGALNNPGQASWRGVSGTP